MTYDINRIAASRWIPSVIVAAFIAVATGCSERPSAPSSIVPPTAASASAAVAGVGDQLGHLRAALARFHDIEVAKAAGYTIELTGCYVDESPAARGAMGFHFGKASAINKLTPDPLEPEALLYEPQSNGRYRLVGVEFLIPYTLLPRSSTPPTLFGQAFAQNDTFQVWALHAWVWKHNPSGMFASWNPNVSCDAAAPTVARVSHGGH
jgi:hypothetical protein